MRILHIITGLRKIAGTSVFVCRLADEQVKTGNEVSILIKETWRKDCHELDKRVIVRVLGSNHCNLCAYDVAHIHGLWDPWLHRVVVLLRKSGVPFVWSPHGMLTAWAFNFKWWKKLPAWWLWQKCDVARASLIHVTADQEIEDVRRVHLHNRVAVVPLGVDSSLYLEKDKTISSRRILFVGRVHPIKGLPVLLKAFADVDAAGWRIRIVGPDQDGHLAELQNLAKELGIAERIDFVGPRFDVDLRKEFQYADLFVLPSHSENFGSVVLEALSAGTPVIASRGTPWKELETYGCGIWAEAGEAGLSRALRLMISKTDDERREMGGKGRELVCLKYDWSVVGKAMMCEYEEVVCGA